MGESLAEVIEKILLESCYRLQNTLVSFKIMLRN